MRNERGLRRGQRAPAAPDGIRRGRALGLPARRELHAPVLPRDGTNRNGRARALWRLRHEPGRHGRSHGGAAVLADGGQLLREDRRCRRRREACGHGPFHDLPGRPRRGAPCRRPMDRFGGRKNRQRAAHDRLPGDLSEDAAVTHAGRLDGPRLHERAVVDDGHVAPIHVRDVRDVPLRAAPVSPPWGERIAGSQGEPADEAAAGRDRDRPAGSAAHEGDERGRVGDVPHVGSDGNPAPARRANGPAAVVIGRPSPGLRRDPGPAPRVLPDPVSDPVRRPVRVDVRRIPDVAVLRRLLPPPVRIEIRDAEDVLAREVVRHDAVTPALARVHPSIPRIGQRQREDVVFGLVDAVDVHRLARAHDHFPAARRDARLAAPHGEPRVPVRVDAHAVEAGGFQRDGGVRRVDLEDVLVVHVGEAERRRALRHRILLHVFRQVEDRQLSLRSHECAESRRLQLHAPRRRGIDPVSDRHRNVDGDGLPVIRIVAPLEGRIARDGGDARDRLLEVLLVAGGLRTRILLRKQDGSAGERQGQRNREATTREGDVHGAPLWTRASPDQRSLHSSKKRSRRLSPRSHRIRRQDSRPRRAATLST